MYSQEYKSSEVYVVRYMIEYHHLHTHTKITIINKTVMLMVYSITSVYMGKRSMANLVTCIFALL